MSRSSDIFVLGATRLVVGLSSILSVPGQAFQVSGTFKKLSGGTFEIVQGPSTGWGTGYIMGDTETFNFSGPAKYYIAAHGTTLTVGYVVGYSNGATLL